MKKNNVELGRNKNLRTVKKVVIFVVTLSYDISEDNYEGNFLLPYYIKWLAV